LGVIYTPTSDGKQLRHNPSKDMRESLIKKFYVPHHWRLSRIVSSILIETRQALIVDCHSFSSFPLPYEQDQRDDRPDICLGTDPFHTPLWLGSLASSLFISGSFFVDVNRPFSGVLVPGEYYRTDARVLAIMVEINRGLYMNEHTGNKKPDFVVIKERLQTILRELVETTAERVTDQQRFLSRGIL
jgi:N-formylglutamate deformylase